MGVMKSELWFWPVLVSLFFLSFLSPQHLSSLSLTWSLHRSLLVLSHPLSSAFNAHLMTFFQMPSPLLSVFYLIMPLLCVVFLLCLLRHLSSVPSDSSAKRKTLSSSHFALRSFPYLFFLIVQQQTYQRGNISTLSVFSFLLFCIGRWSLLITTSFAFFYCCPWDCPHFFLFVFFSSSTLCVSVCWCMKKKGRFLTWEFQTFQETPFHLLLSTPACWDGNFSSPTKYYISHHCGLLFSFFFSHMAGICDTVFIFSFFSCFHLLFGLGLSCFLLTLFKPRSFFLIVPYTYHLNSYHISYHYQGRR